ncbi:MAG: hypothetical protein WEC17_01470 [Candidatus Saccharimonadales bacterium]
MERPELALPPLSLTQRLSFGVADILNDVEWDPRPESGLELRAKKVALDDSRLVTIKQVRAPSVDTPVVRNAIRLELYDRQFLATWFTGSLELSINDFEYTDDIEVTLQEVKRLVLEQDDQA